MYTTRVQFRIKHSYDDDDMHSVNMLGNQNVVSASCSSTQHRPSLIIWLTVLTARVFSQSSRSIRDVKVTNGHAEDDSSLSTAVWSILSSPGTDCIIHFPPPIGM